MISPKNININLHLCGIVRKSFGSFGVRGLNGVEINPAAYMEMANSAQVGLLVVRDEKIVFVNPVVKKTTQYSDTELIGMYYADLIFEEDRKFAINTVNKIIKGKRKDNAQSVRLRVLGKEKNSIWIKAGINKFIWQGKEALLFSAMNINDLCKAEEKARLANLAKNEFLAHMSHEIRTPLLGISGFCELFSQEELSSRQKESVENIRYCTEQLLGLVSNILDLSRIEARQVAMNQKPFSIKSMIEHMVQSLGIRVDKNKVDLQVEISSEIPERLIGDELKIRQVLNNLLTNAIKFTEEGYIKIIAERDDENSTMLPAVFPLKISVCDSGIGISHKKSRDIFKAFVQLDCQQNMEHKGAGLGLAISKQLVEIMGGRIWYEPEQGNGSAFSFLLPMQEVFTEECMESDEDYLLENTGIPAVSGSNVLLVEDIGVNRKLIKYMLEDMGCDVITARNGKECIEILHKSSPDLILMDMQMPVMDGYQATAIIRESPKHRRIPIIALTAYAFSGDVDRCLQAGCNSYLSKPFTREQLCQSLNKCLERETAQVGNASDLNM